MIELTDSEARELAILLDGFADENDRAAEWRDKLWDRRRIA